ncbi:MAG: alkaline phosphatase [Verrucomicrobiales bacterium]|jgi:alkaline phosphatase|nr:alkaline phosphatase [Verrucomicrobiales bacterium]
MNWRLKVLSVLILGLFAAFALGYYKYFVAPKPSGVILFIVPGLNLDHLARAGTPNLLTDSARIAIINNTPLATPPFQINSNTIFSYLATGYKTHGDRLGLSTDGRVQDNLLYLAQRAGRTVGIIGTGSITAVELAAFYAHTKNPANPVDILQQLFDNTKINVILSGGADDFNQVRQHADRDLFHEADLYGYTIVRDHHELQHLPVWRTRRLLGVFAPRHLPFHTEPPASRPSLADLTRHAIQCLQFTLNGYFLIIHDSLIADAIHDHRPNQITAEIEQLNHALTEARDLVGDNSVILLYSPHNIPADNDTPADQHLGWLAIYADHDTPIKGFATGKDLFRYLRRQLDWKQF